MTIYDGVVTFEDNSVPVIIGFQEDGIRMSSGGTEIGVWTDDEYSIDARGAGVYSITAENETLRFVPSNPTLFAAMVDGGVVALPSMERAEPELAPTPQEAGEADDDEDTQSPVAEAPPPKPVTLVGFYGLATFTAVLGIWALISLFVG